jgi:nucleolar protein 58
MLVLFESSAGYGLFKCDDKVMKAKKDDIYDKYFADPTKAASKFKLEAFAAFEDTSEAVSAASSSVEGDVNKKLAKFLKKNLKDGMTLGIADVGMASKIKEKISGLTVVSNDNTFEIMRGIRSTMDTLMSDEVSTEDMKSMALGLSHSLSRYKLKFSPDKVDTMIIQAVGLLDELDKEINTYAMRVKEWYGWHFPELAKVRGVEEERIDYPKTKTMKLKHN